ncbi:MAG: SDR family NAD(P)-dependent oxidoreductase [Flavitalea sp.]
MKPYSIITGASEGLGKAYALELAKRNHNLVLVALPSSGLACLASFIERNFEVKVFIIETDLSTKENCLDLYKRIKNENLKINMLINNAGMGGYYWFNEKSVEFYQLQIALNVSTPTLLIKLFLQDLIENGPSHILNISSLSGFFSMPRKQVYAATKSYMRFFSLSLHQELKQSGVQVSVVCPGGIKSRLPIILMAKDKKGMAKWSILHPEEVASYSIEQMMAGEKMIIPGFWNRFFLILDKLIPSFIKEKLINREIADSRTYEPLKRFKKENFEASYFFSGNRVFRPAATQPAN